MTGFGDVREQDDLYALIAGAAWARTPSTTSETIATFFLSMGGFSLVQVRLTCTESAVESK